METWTQQLKFPGNINFSLALKQRVVSASLIPLWQASRKKGKHPGKYLANSEAESIHSILSTETHAHIFCSTQLIESHRPAWLEMDGSRRGVKSRSLFVPLWWQWSIFWSLAHRDLGGEVGIKTSFICCGQSQTDRSHQITGEDGWRERDKKS